MHWYIHSSLIWQTLFSFIIVTAKENKHFIHFIHSFIHCCLVCLIFQRLTCLFYSSEADLFILIFRGWLILFYLSEADIPVVGNVFSFVITKYPPDWRWRFLKVSLFFYNHCWYHPPICTTSKKDKLKWNAIFISLSNFRNFRLLYFYRPFVICKNYAKYFFLFVYFS